MSSPNAWLCRACLGGCHPCCHVIPSCPGAGIGLPAARHQWPSPLVSCNLQDTAQPAQRRGLLKQNHKEGSSKCHVGTGQGLEQAQRSLAASQCLTCCPGVEPCIPSAAGWAAPRQGRRHGGGLATGRRLQAGFGTGSGSTQTRLSSTAAD